MSLQGAILPPKRVVALKAKIVGPKKGVRKKVGGAIL